MSAVVVEVPIKTVSLQNVREHWRATARRKKAHREAVQKALDGKKAPALPVVVTIERVSAGTLDAHDNLPSSQKNVVDAIAGWLGIDDADPRVEWRYAQAKGQAGHCKVRLDIRSAA